jgi:response regulator RpfG family c-di-GMP phosphodiesterase
LLVVDDEPQITTTLADKFHHDYRVFTASSGDEALAILHQEDISVIVTDQRMPEMTGSELLAKARLINPDASRILLAGFADINAVVEAVNKGKHLFLSGETSTVSLISAVK